MIWYVTKDIERALGIDFEKYSDVRVVSNHSPLADLFKKFYPARILLKEEGGSTLELLEKIALEIQKKDKNPEIIVFKNSSQIERCIKKNKWTLLNPKAKLIEKFEHKINQYNLLKNVKGIRLPETKIAVLEKLDFEKIKKELGAPFILQYNLGHTGSGTKIIDEAKTLEEEKTKYPKREAKITKFIYGDCVTLNACVLETEIAVGAISLQLTGINGLTDNKLATVGNDWAYVENNLDKKQLEGIKKIAVRVGEVMREAKWKGLFGLDIIVEKETKDLYVIEINARQPASASFETRLRNLQKENGPMDWHYTALKDKNISIEAEKAIRASQMFLRKQNGALAERFQKIDKVGEYDSALNLIEEKALFELEDKSDLFVIPQNKKEYKPNEEIVRIQMLGSFMERMFPTAR
ncbi:MAG: hypothetical protein A3F24_02950 [Candidatus Colwellbacteria bacterium RIFCSPHIGHO2_12_FULL_44_17]|uniref:ATP-grasp domain-containing protein n=2 Tax=Candidatus Colwelliibacteriota TaxID=1817904 RepID=A0A1G1ZAF5_9BACT|nr:MAG: hypothetical protein A3F24_02950 [Candidatus Colwellbacteria bacterium RIFCSPHIGHO2_12_FULL_44_17]OGY60850.1 MAG: hypothetical protein A3I31_03240 [Candidatus Colwellbacteria bacterium RIFCSPLOWO2_02_FULL_44_20b]